MEQKTKYSLENKALFWKQIDNVTTERTEFLFHGGSSIMQTLSEIHQNITMFCSPETHLSYIQTFSRLPAFLLNCNALPFESRGAAEYRSPSTNSQEQHHGTWSKYNKLINKCFQPSPVTRWLIYITLPVTYRQSEINNSECARTARCPPPQSSPGSRETGCWLMETVRWHTIHYKRNQALHSFVKLPTGPQWMFNASHSPLLAG